MVVLGLFLDGVSFLDGGGPLSLGHGDCVCLTGVNVLGISIHYQLNSIHFLIGHYIVLA